MKRLIAVAILACSAVAQNAEANLIVNGSFEAPATPPGGGRLLDPGDLSLTGWTILAQISVGNTTFNCCGYAGLPAFDGSNWLDMTGNNDNGTGGISQTVATIAGHTYLLSYDVGNAISIGDPNFSSGPSGRGATSRIVVTVTGTAGFIDTNATQSNAFTWAGFGHTFVATGSATTFTFSNGDVVGDILNGFDNVVLLDVTQPSTGVPEPETLLLIGLGALVAASARRRKT